MQRTCFLLLAFICLPISLESFRLANCLLFQCCGFETVCGWLGFRFPLVLCYTTAMRACHPDNGTKTRFPGDCYGHLLIAGGVSETVLQNVFTMISSTSGLKARPLLHVDPRPFQFAVGHGAVQMENENSNRNCLTIFSSRFNVPLALSHLGIFG